MDKKIPVTVENYNDIDKIPKSIQSKIKNLMIEIGQLILDYDQNDISIYLIYTNNRNIKLHYQIESYNQIKSYEEDDEKEDDE